MRPHHNVVIEGPAGLDGSSQSQRATRLVKPAMVAVVAFVTTLAMLSFPLPASARGKNSTVTPTSLSLVSETVQMNPKLPGVSCFTEDDFDQKVFSGALNGSYSTSYQLCDLNTDGFTAGGIGLQSSVAVVGQISDLTITAPDGTVHHAVAIGQTTAKGVTTNYYEVCYVPPYFLSTDTSTDPLSGGAWQITLSGDITNAKWIADTQMTDVNVQETDCPSSEQNLLS